MRETDAILNIHQKRGAKGLPLERVYKHLFNPELYLRAYGKIYRNDGAMTEGTTKETVDGMDLQRIHNIIGFLRGERYKWTPVRRTEIPKAKGGTRPLGIPTWSDKLVQEAMRMLLEPYYEQRFSENSHGFRPNRGCHTALRTIQRVWKGTVWFIEGDIKGCFDNINHEVLLETIRRDIHDGRIVTLIDNLLRTGYMENWRYYETESGTPQGGIISPLLSNIYLDNLDRYVEDTLIPAYTRGVQRRHNPEYEKISRQLEAARKQEESDKIRPLKRERRKLTRGDPRDPGYRRLRYIRYAADFLLGFIGPRKEAEEIRDRLREFLEQRLKLTLSKEKTLITHASDEKAKFLGYEIMVVRDGSLISKNGSRSTNGKIGLLMPREVVLKYQKRYSKSRKVVHRADLLAETNHTIVQRFQSVLRGLYNYYSMAVNVSARMGYIKWILETSLTKTLASKLRCSVSDIYRKYRAVTDGLECIRIEIERPEKKPLAATFGGIRFERNPDGIGTGEFRFRQTWFTSRSRRSETVQRMLVDRCELCGEKGPVEVHHIRKLADIDRPGRRPKEPWERIMAARKRKTLVICRRCHDDIHAGRYDGQAL